MAQLVTDAASEPVTLALVKTYSRIETGTEEDTLLTALIRSCRQEIEGHCLVAFLPQVWEDLLDTWPSSGRAPVPVYSPRVPAASAIVECKPASGSAYTAFTEVTLRNPTGRLVPSGIAPYAGVNRDGIRITWTVGYPNTAAIPGPLLTALLDLITYRYEHRGQDELVTGSTTGVPDTLLAQLAPYRISRI